MPKRYGSHLNANNFKQICLKRYRLDPHHYFASPGLSLNSLLRYTNTELDYITDLEFYLFIEKDIIGGVSTITHQYGKVNNSTILG